MAEPIDLLLCGISEEGIPTYGSPMEAAAFECGRRIGWLVCTYPRETLNALALVAVVGVCACLIST